MIKIRDLKVHKKNKLICSLEELVIGEGERIALIGSNGSGKSTLLRVIAGLEKASAGQCDIAVAVRHRCYVHQSPYMFRGTVLSNVAYGLRALGQRKSESIQQANEMLDRMGLAKLKDQPSQQLSGGERRRVAVARAFVVRPRLLLLDEPFAELDNDGSDLLQQNIDRLQKEFGCTVLISSPLESARLQTCRRVQLQAQQN